MIYLLDTNVVSETMKPTPNPSVDFWLNSLPKQDLWTCSIVIAEILSGLDLMPDGRRKIILQEKARQLFLTLFPERVFFFDLDSAQTLGQIRKKRTADGHPIQAMDALIAAIAAAHSATIVTRNTRDFEGCGVELFNPWSEAGE